ncbi:MAG: serine/threonine protein kinase [Candidatus Bathyarchaeota archaeon]|nr:serine/threonine protein kinase [Candidatus Bathyarchaeota archaeon]
MRSISIQVLAQELNVDESAVYEEIPQVIKQLQNENVGNHYFVSNGVEKGQSAKIVVVEKKDVEYLSGGQGTLGLLDLVAHFGFPAKDVNWLLLEMLNHGVIEKSLHDYYTNVKDKPHVKAWFEPQKVTVGQKATLNIEITCPCKISDPKIEATLPLGLELEEEPKLPHKLYGGKFTGKYQYHSNMHGNLSVGVGLGGAVNGLDLDPQVNTWAVLEVAPLSPKLVVVNENRSYEAYYQEPFRLVLDVCNQGLGAAQNTELKGLERHPTFEVLEPTKIGNVAAHGSVKFKISLKPKKSGTHNLSDLTLYYEDLLGNPLNSPLPKTDITVTTPQPNLKVDLLIPQAVAQKKVFSLTVKISNIGEGDAKNVRFALPLDPAVIQSGLVDCNIPRLKSDETEEFLLRLRAPETSELVVPDFDVEMQDVEGTALTERIFGFAVPIREGGEGTSSSKKRAGWPFRVNRVIGGQYRIVEEVGEGGFAKVYRVRRSKFREELALKALKAEFVTNPSVVERFIEEAKLTSDLREDHIVSVRQVDIEDQGDLEYPYIIMEHLNGGTLSSILALGEPLDLLKCTEIMNDLCLALSYAHQHGTIHFDVKPSNVFYDNKKKLWKLGDFGLAKAITLGNVAAPRGSLPYMAPEMREGKGSSKSDIYSLGQVFREILTGTLNGDLQRLQKSYGNQAREELKVYIELIGYMLSPDPAERPSIRDLLSVFSASKTKPAITKRKPA